MPPESPPASPLAPPIADYQLLRLIGRGSYGDVWLARGVTGVFRAIKIVWRDRFIDVRPYEREFEGITRFAAISLREPSQLALLHAGRQDGAGFFYYVMELADDVARGREIDPATYAPYTLKDFSAQRGHRLDTGEVVALGTALARALASLHAAGLVHRDIKPSNVILVGGVPKLADVGLVAVASAALTFVGTEGFVPPEGPGAPAADVYSLGKLLYELATGLDRHDYPRLPPDLDTRPDQRALLELNEVIVRACEPDARQRFPDAAALLDELLLLQAGKSVRGLRRAERRTARALRFAAVFALVAGIAGVGAYVERQRANEETQLRRQAEAERDALARRTVYAARLAQAQRALEQDDYGRARRLLADMTPAAGEPDLRHFEWRALSHLARGDPCEILRASGPAIDRLVISTDRNLLAVHDEAKCVTLYDVATLREVRTIVGVQRLAGFSSDGTWIVGTDLSNALQRWRSSDGSITGSAHDGAVFRPLGTQGLARVVALIPAIAADATKGSMARPASLVVWDFADEREVHRLPLGEPDDALPWEFFRGALNSSGDEAALVYISGYAASRRYRLSRMQLGATASVLHHLVTDFLPGSVGALHDDNNQTIWWTTEVNTGRTLSWSPSAQRWEAAPHPLATGLSSQVVLNTPREKFLLQSHHANISVRSWNRAPAEATELHGHATLITSVVSADDGRHFFTASEAGELRRWDVASVRAARARQGWNSLAATNHAVFSADSRSVYISDNGQNVAVLDPGSMVLQGVISGLRRPIGCTVEGLVGITADGFALAHWQRGSGNVTEIGRTTAAIVQAALSADRKRLCFIRANGELCTTTIEGGGETKTVPGRHENLWSLRLDATGARLWTVSNQRRVECRSLPHGAVMWSTPLPAMPTSLCALPAGSVGVALQNGDIQVHDENTGTLLRTSPSGSAAAQSVTTTPDGTRLMAAGVEGDLHVIDAASGTYLASVPVRAVGTLHHVTISPDGRTAAVLGKTGLLQVVPAW